MPFDGNTPILNILTLPDQVAQTLVDYESVVLLDTLHRSAVYIELQDGKLSQRDATREGVQRLLTLFGMDPNVHIVQKVISGRLPYIDSTLERYEEVAGLPHAQGVPMLTANHDTYENMLAASTQGHRSFWLPHEGNYILIRPWEEPLFERTRRHAAKELRRVREGFLTAENTYGRAYAGLIWGQPLPPDTWPNPAQIEHPNIVDYPRFGSHSASRRELIQALQVHGRLRLYITSIAQGGPKQDSVFKVRLEPAHGQHPVRVSIEELDKKKILAEKALAIVRKFKLPEKLAQLRYY